MNPRGSFLAVATFLLTCGGPPLLAQQSSTMVRRGIAAYDSLDFDRAAGWLRRALTPPLDETLPPVDRVRALSYLGATERFRSRSDSAAAVFRRLLRFAPDARMDPLIFPPDVTQLFEDVRTRTKTVAIRAPRDTALEGATARYIVALIPTSHHEVTVDLERRDGQLIRRLYAGPIGDRFEVDWDGKDSTALPVPSGRFWLNVGSSDRGRAVCITQLPLELTRGRLDSVLTPPPLQGRALLPERAGGSTGIRAFAGALLLGAAALALPRTITPDADAGDGRYLVAGTLGLAAVIGFAAQAPGRPLPENVRINAERRARWERQVALATAVNAERRTAAPFRIQTGAPTQIECGPP
jgi:hypothetical protein